LKVANRKGRRVGGSRSSCCACRSSGGRILGARVRVRVGVKRKFRSIDHFELIGVVLDIDQRGG